MDILKQVKETLEQQDAQEKEIQLSVLDDTFEYKHGLNEDEIVEGARLLLAAALREDNQAMQQKLFRTINKAVVFHTIGARIDWDTLVTLLPSLGKWELVYVLEILGFSGQARYLPVLKEYTHHADPKIRESAIDAIEAMDYRLTQSSDAQKES